MEALINETRDLIGVTLTDKQLACLKIYARELDVWNQRYSLTAIVEPEKVRVKHFLDSFSTYLVMKGSLGQRVIDVGTGAGFPGIPLKILLPDLQVTLVDSVRKKTEFCRHVIDALQLEGIQVERARIEHLGQQPAYREQYDWAIARAVAHLSTLSEYLLPLVRVGGRALAMKGEQGPHEAHQAQSAVSLLGGDLQQIKKVTLPGVVEERYLITIHKKATTPEKYPRRVGTPGKRPL